MIELEDSAGIVKPEKAMTAEARARYADLHLKILRIVLRHRRGAHIKGEQIGMTFSIDPRVVAEIIGRLRREGFCICSGAEGYCYADTLEQWVEDLEKEHGRGVAILDRVSESHRNTVNAFELFDQTQTDKAA